MYFLGAKSYFLKIEAVVGRCSVKKLFLKISAQVFSCEFYEFLKSTFFYRAHPVAASV